ncbi:unnamed protein product [Trichobilharzia regenti]|nr:unnamed protein product [Trichobilharzia regenti]
MPSPNWCRIKLQNAEAIHRLLVGASPVRARFALLQNYSLSRLSTAASLSDNIKEDGEGTPGKLSNSNPVVVGRIPNNSNNNNQSHHDNLLVNNDNNNNNNKNPPALIGGRSSARNGVLLQSPGC